MAIHGGLVSADQLRQQCHQVHSDWQHHHPCQKIEEDENSTLVRFEVQDTGIGICDEIKPGCFSRSSRWMPRYRNYGGTGLGLPSANN